MRKLSSVCVLLGLLFSTQASAGPLAVKDVPEPLKPWVQWVLHGQEERQCPFLYNNADRYRCTWPSGLTLDLKDTGSSFSQRWRVMVEGWVSLPGENSQWPQNVKVDDSPALVSDRSGVPSIYLPSGLHTVSGEFAWERLPESVQIPAETGLVSTTLNGRKILFPDIDNKGRLWLKQRGAGQRTRDGMRNTLDVQVFRRIVDQIPLQMITRIELDVAGDHREVLLGRALMPEYIPMVLTSPLPARLESDGRLRIQVRPGHWTVELIARHPGPVDSIALNSQDGPWPAEEVWVFDARNHLRLVRIEGVNSIDPRQTSLPADWKSLPTYRLRPGDTLRMEVKRRGDPHPEPDKLSLVRSLWLDFDGRGYTLQDKVDGTITQSWRLEVAPDLKLGRVVVDGRPQFITRHEGTQREGVELRRGRVHLIADSRFKGNVSRIPAIGWEHDFRQVRGRLHLPPGWRLLTTTGIDEVRHTWVNRWSLFDLFVLLIIAAAVAKLWGWSWGAVALVTLAFIYHEPGAPRQVWLYILAAVALLRVLPSGRFKQLISLYRNVSLIALAIIAFPFAVNQVRVALFPQLERPLQIMGEPGRGSVGGALLERADDKEAKSRRKAPAEAPSSGRALLQKRSAEIKSRLSSTPFMYYDAGAVIQTGPGLPRWSWRTVRLNWNGPVERGQEIQLVLIPPIINLALRLVSVLLLAVLFWRVLDLTYGGGFRFVKLGGTLLALLITSGGMPAHARGEIPSDKVLAELRERLLEKPACLPQCSQSPRMRLDVSNDMIRLRMEIHVLADLAVPLPGRQGQWQAQLVFVGGKAIREVFRDGVGRQWLRLPKGQHQVLLEGRLPALDRVQIDLPLKPHRVEAKAQGWIIEGIHENGIVDSQLQFRRIRANASQRDSRALEPGALPPFVRVERLLRLGLEWQVETRVIRASPRGSAVVVEIPLLAGESVTSGGVRAEHGKVLVNMAPQQSHMNWQSVLEKSEKIVLSAPKTTEWTEVWRLDSSPIWHVESVGIPVVHHQDQGRWLPEWRPWPGESVSLAVTRPEGVEGKTLTINASTLTLRPGRRAMEVELAITLRSSQGGQHNLTLPEDALLQSVRINGKSQPIRQEGQKVSLPVTPGLQNLKLSWQQPTGIGERFVAPVVGLGIESVNSSVKVVLPRNRWVLFTGGPRLGPAVLFWGLFIVIVLVALFLGRIGRIPLKTVHWMLLGLGLTQVPVMFAVVVVGWLFALSARREVSDRLSNGGFNFMQIGLGVLTVAALGVLYFAVRQGLLGWPNMYIAGNGSSSYLLQWFQDRAGMELPRPWVLSVPTVIYRVLMLVWALWLALALLRWLRWGWECFSVGGIWRTVSFTWRGTGSKPAAPAAPDKAET